MNLTHLWETNAVPRYYFAYGMLTDPEVMGDIPLVGAAVLNNWRFELLQFANLVPASGSRVYGALWQANDQIMHELDQVEGYPNFYDRKTMPVTCQGRRYVAEVYIMTPESREDLIDTQPNKGYIRRLMRGYSHAGLPIEQIQQGLT